jgi:di/tricarboxylate transporter
MALAHAVESVNLHRRIALFVLTLVGTSTKWYFRSCSERSNERLCFSRSMAGLMSVTAFLSMWINNSAATSIMLPVAIAITDELERHTKEFHEKQNATKDMPDNHSNLTFCSDVLDLTKVDLSMEPQRSEVILDASHLSEQFVHSTMMSGIQMTL